MFQLYALSSKDTNRCKNILVSFPPSRLPMVEGWLIYDTVYIQV